MKIFSSINLMAAFLLSLSIVQVGFAKQEADLQVDSFRSFKVVPLVSNPSSEASFTDSRLQNPIGLVVSPAGFLLVANNHHSKVTAYAPSGKPLENFVIKTSPHITGLIRNDSDDFFIHSGGDRFKASLLLCTAEGKILAYNRNVNSGKAQVVIDRSSFCSVYTGLAIAQSTVRNQHILYAADFYNGKVDMFTNEFEYMGSFTDPDLPAGYVPFNVRRISSVLYVTFAEQDESGKQPLAGAGKGFISMFSPQGIFVKRLVSGEPLNAPWGIEIVPQEFADFNRVLVVGNHGDGTIHAFNPVFGGHLGSLNKANGQLISIPGLWSLNYKRATGDRINPDPLIGDYQAGDLKRAPKPPFLYFTAGGCNGNRSLIGAIVPNPIP